jgi:hypothetical protein
MFDIIKEKHNKSEMPINPALGLKPKFERDIWFYIIAAVSILIILIIILPLFIVPAFNVSYHSLDEAGNTITISVNFMFIELLRDSRQLLEALLAVTFESNEARSGMSFFMAWVIAFATLFCVVVGIRFIIMLFLNVEKSSDTGKFAFGMIILLMLLIIALSYFANTLSFEAPIRIFGLGTKLSPAYQFSLSLFPYLIVQYITLIVAIAARIVLIKKLDQRIWSYNVKIRELKYLR